MIESSPAINDPVGYDTLETISKARHFNKWMYDTIHPFIKGNILEIGSGVGNISHFIVLNFNTVTLSDYNQDYCKGLKDQFSRNGNVKDIYSLDLQHPDFTVFYKNLQHKYDTVILLNVIEHLKNDAKAVENCHFLLKAGGNLIVLAPAYNFLYSKLDKAIGHYRRYSAASLASLFNKKAFEMVCSQYFNLLGAGGWLFFNRIMRKKKIEGNSMALFDKMVPLAKSLDHLTGHKAGLSAIAVGKKK